MRQWRSCAVCASPGADVHHIVSRGSGGGDVPYNLLHLCRKCHTEVHIIGWVAFGRKYPRVYGKIMNAREIAGRTTEGRARC